MAPAPLALHQRCRVAKLGAGEVLFVGQTSFAPGLWIGIQLDEPLGKNDGSVQGKRYFHTEPGYGVFVRASQVAPEDTGAPSTPRSAETAAPAPAPRTAPPMRHLATPESRPRPAAPASATRAMSLESPTPRACAARGAP